MAMGLWAYVHIIPAKDSPANPRHETQLVSGVNYTGIVYNCNVRICLKDGTNSCSKSRRYSLDDGLTVVILHAMY